MYKKLKISILLLAISTYSYGQSNIGEGLYRIEFPNYKNCIIEYQSNTPDFKEIDLKKSLPLLKDLKALNTGLELKFPIYKAVDYKEYPTLDSAARFGERQVKLFEQSLKNLKNFETTPKAEELKQKLIVNYEKRLRFEKIFVNWMKTKDDTTFRKNMLNYRIDYLTVQTLDKLMPEKDWKYRLKYMHSELHDVFKTYEYSDEEHNRDQIKFLSENKLKFATTPNCNY